MTTSTAPRFDAQDAAFIAEKVESYRFWGLGEADALAMAAEYDSEGETGVGDWYRAVAEQLRSGDASDLAQSCECGHTRREHLDDSVEDAGMHYGECAVCGSCEFFARPGACDD